MEIKVVVDPYTDANGHWTIRFADGTIHGNTDRQPIATVYSKNAANIIVAALNCSNVCQFLGNE